MPGLRASLVAALAAGLVACGAAPSGADDDLPTSADRRNDNGGDTTIPGDPVPGEIGGEAKPVPFAVGDAVVVAQGGFLPRGIMGGDVALSKEEADGKLGYHVVAATGGSPTLIEGNLTASEASLSVEGRVVVIRKGTPSQKTVPMSVWSRASGLKNLGTVVRHYGAFAASPDGTRIAYVSSARSLRVGPIGSPTTLASNLNIESESCTPHIEYQGDLLVSSTCSGTSASASGGDLRTWPVTGAAKTIAPEGSVGYNGFGFGGTTTHLLYDKGGIGSPLTLVDLATGSATSIDAAGRSSSAVLSADAKTAFFSSSSRSEVRRWHEGSSSMFADRVSTFRVAPNGAWLVGTRTFPTPSKVLLVDASSGAPTEIAENAYVSTLTGDSARFFYTVSGSSTKHLYDVAKKSSQPVGAYSIKPIPGRAEVFAIECPAGATFDSPVCTLLSIDTATLVKTTIDTKVSSRFYLTDHTIAYVRESSVVTRTVEY